MVLGAGITYGDPLRCTKRRHGSNKSYREPKKTSGVDHGVQKQLQETVASTDRPRGRPCVDGVEYGRQK
ncbi:hypothetical protein RRG08_018550 [Elysia crispata]|uniref:Uncharacterized protein n=1 Tax=Elysia crispata TaxID=231223 RepID=A0AAE1E2B2_9GAST|nr:hypothetical protein RRG08_018550 [Elysia crispata]